MTDANHKTAQSAEQKPTPRGNRKLENRAKHEHEASSEALSTTHKFADQSARVAQEVPFDGRIVDKENTSRDPNLHLESSNSSNQRLEVNTLSRKVERELSPLMGRIEKSSNKRIVFSFSVIVLVLITIAFALTDYVGFARGWSFFSKIVTGQDVTTTSASAAELYGRLGPMFANFEASKRALSSLRERDTVNHQYLNALESWKARNFGSIDQAFDQLVKDIRSVTENNAAAQHCSSATGVPVLDYVYGIGGPSADKKYSGSISLRFCLERQLEEIIGATPDNLSNMSAYTMKPYQFADLITNEVSAEQRDKYDYKDVLTKATIDKLSAGVDVTISFISNDISRIQLGVEKLKKLMDEQESALNLGLSNYLNINKVNVGQDISFIISRIILIVTLLSLAGTALKVMLNEIRFVNRLNEMRIASIYLTIHPKDNMFGNIYKSIMGNSDIGKNDGEIGLSVKELKDLAKTILQGAAKSIPGSK